MEDISEVFQAAQTLSDENRRSIIRVIGVGGAGCNTVKHMHKVGIKDVTFIVCNTDKQSLDSCPIETKVQLGQSLTHGLGAGNNPECGRNSAMESLSDIEAVLEGAHMVFVTAGMGGGTGTGAAPVIAKVAKDKGILTIGVVSIPYKYEGRQRIQQAIDGIKEMQNGVDSLLIINNERLRDYYGNLPLSKALSNANEILTTATKGIAEMISHHRTINVDLADVRTAMSNSGTAIMGMGHAGGEMRVKEALEQAVSSPLLNSNDITGAQNILLNITCGEAHEITQDEQDVILETLQMKCNNNGACNIIWGFGTDEREDDTVQITLVATGFPSDSVNMSNDARAAVEVTIDSTGNVAANVAQNNDDDDAPSRPIPLSPSNSQLDEDIRRLYNRKEAKRYMSTADLADPTVFALDKLTDNDTILHLEDVPAYVRRRSNK